MIIYLSIDLNFVIFFVILLFSYNFLVLFLSNLIHFNIQILDLLRQLSGWSPYKKTMKGEPEDKLRKSKSFLRKWIVMIYVEETLTC